MDHPPTPSEPPNPRAADSTPSPRDLSGLAWEVSGGDLEFKVGDRIGPYRLVELLGEGGFGLVYLAEQPEPVQRQVALKLLKLGMDTGRVVRRFASERRLLAMMEHPGIAQIHDAGATPTGRPYFVMELVRGEPITAYCDARKLGVRERMALIAEVCDSVQHAHQKGVIHRDLKPSNILIAEENGRARPKIIDFGISKVIEGDDGVSLATEDGVLIGTPEYMSPEQATGSPHEIDTRTDIYSLGVVLCELLVGRVPMDGSKLRRAGATRVREAIASAEPVRPISLVRSQNGNLPEVAKARGAEPAQLLRQLRGDPEWIVMKAVDPDRSRRYASASELGADIRRYLASEPILARPPSVAYRASKLVRRHRAASVLAGVLLLGAIASAIGATVQYYNTVQARQRAEAFAMSEAEARRLADLRTYLNHVAVADWATRAGEVALAWENLDRARGLFAESGPDAEPQASPWELGLLASRLDQSERVLASGLGSPVGFDTRGERLLTLSDRGEPVIGGAGWASPVSDAAGSEPGDNAAVRTIGAFSRDGRAGVTFASSAELVRWTIADGPPQETDRVRLDRAPTALACRDGLVLVGDAAGRVGFITDDGPVFRSAHDAPVTLAEIDPTGSHAVTGDASGVAIVWDARSMRPILSMSAHTGAVLAADIGGRILATGGEDGRICLWDLRTGRRLGTLAGHRGEVLALRFRPSGRDDPEFLLSAGSDLTLRLWDSLNQSQMALMLGHRAPVRTLAWTDDGPISADDAGEVRLWNPARAIAPALGVRAIWDRPVSIVFDNGVIVVEGEHEIGELDAHTLAPINTASSTPVPNSSLNSSQIGSTEITAPSDGRITGDASGEVVLTRGGEEHWRSPALRGPVSAIAIDPGSTRIAAADRTGLVRLLHAQTGERIMTVAEVGQPVEALAFCPEGETLAAALSDGVVRLWSSSSGAIQALAGPEPLDSPAKPTVWIADAHPADASGTRVDHAASGGNHVLVTLYCAGPPPAGPVRVELRGAASSAPGPAATGEATWSRVPGAPLAEAFVLLGPIEDLFAGGEAAIELIAHTPDGERRFKLARPR